MNINLPRVVEVLAKGDQMPDLKVLKIAVLFSTALLVENWRGSAEVFCSSWSEIMTEAILLEGNGMENAENIVDRRTAERMIEADGWLEMFPRVLLLRF